MDWALAADSIRPRRTSACAVRRFSDRRVHASARARASLGAACRSWCGLAAAAGSTVRTPTTSPFTRRGSPWADRIPRSASSLSGARRPSAVATRDRRLRTTAERNGERSSTTAVRSAGSAAASLEPATDCR